MEYILPGTHRHILTLIVLRRSVYTQPAAGAYRLEHHGHSPCVRVFGRDGKRERIDDVRALSFLFGSGHARTVFQAQSTESSLVCAPLAAEAPCTTHRQRSWPSIPLAPADTEAQAITEAGVEAEIHSSQPALNAGNHLAGLCALWYPALVVRHFRLFGSAKRPVQDTRLTIRTTPAVGNLS